MKGNQEMSEKTQVLITKHVFTVHRPFHTSFLIALGTSAGFAALVVIMAFLATVHRFTN